MNPRNSKGRGRGSGSSRQGEFRTNRHRFWREDGEPFTFQREYRETKELFTVRFHGNGKFKKFRNRRLYKGGWVRLVDGFHTGNTTLWLLYDCCRKVGLSGFCFMWYKKPMMGLEEGLLYLKTESEVQDMLKWVVAGKVCDIYITQPSKEFVLSLLRGEVYYDLRRMWPKAVIKEITDDEAMMIRLENLGKEKTLMLEWYPTDQEDGTGEEVPVIDGPEGVVGAEPQGVGLVGDEPEGVGLVGDEPEEVGPVA